MALVVALQAEVDRLERMLETVAQVVRQPLTPIVHAAAQLGPAAQVDGQVRRAHAVITRSRS